MRQLIPRWNLRIKKQPLEANGLHTFLNDASSCHTHSNYLVGHNAFLPIRLPLASKYVHHLPVPQSSAAPPITPTIKTLPPPPSSLPTVVHSPRSSPTSAIVAPDPVRIQVYRQRCLRHRLCQPPACLFHERLCAMDAIDHIPRPTRHQPTTPLFLMPTVLPAPSPSRTTCNKPAATNVQPRSATCMSNGQLSPDTRAVLIEILQHSRAHVRPDLVPPSGPTSKSASDPSANDQPEATLTTTSLHADTIDDPPFLPSPLLSSLYFTVGSAPPVYPHTQYSSHQLVHIGLPILDHLRQLRLEKSRQSSANYITVVRRVAQFAFSIVLFLNPFK